MATTKSIQINIPNPCSQNWDEMTPTQQGRFCAHCQKTVIDFTTWSDAALFNFFSKDHGRVCGRFMATQVNRTIAIPYQPHSRLYRIAVALGLTLMFTQAPQALAQNRPPKTEQNSLLKLHEPANNNNFGEIKGQVLDEKKEPMISAAVQVYMGGILKGGAVTDYDGNYVIKPLEWGTYDVLVIYAGYDSVRMTDVMLSDPDGIMQNFQMSRPKTSLSQVIVMGYRKPLVDHDKKLSIITGERNIQVMPTGGAINLVALSPSVYQQKRGTAINTEEINKLQKAPQTKPQIDRPGKRTLSRDETKQMPY